MDEIMLDASAFERLKAAVGDDPADLIDIIESFLEEAPSLLLGMTKAAELADVATVNRLSHSLKSNARDLGASRLAALCQALEDETRSGSVPENLKEQVSELNVEWDKIKSAMHAEIARIGRTT